MNNGQLNQNLLDDDLDGSRHRAATLDTIDEEDEDESSDVDQTVVGEPVGGGAGGANVKADATVGTATLMSSTFQLANCAIGAGVLAFPYAFANCGLALGALLLMYVVRACVHACRGEGARACALQREQLLINE